MTHNDVALVIDFHEAEVCGTLMVHWQAADGDVSACGSMVLHKLHVVHAIAARAPQMSVLIQAVPDQPCYMSQNPEMASHDLLCGCDQSGTSMLYS